MLRRRPNEHVESLKRVAFSFNFLLFFRFELVEFSEGTLSDLLPVPFHPL